MKKQIFLSGFSDEISPDFSTQLRVAAENGLSHIEIRGVDGRNIAEYSPKEAEVIRAALDKQGLGISSIGSPIGKIKITDDFEPHFKAYQNVVEVAKALGTDCIRMFSFFIPEGANPADSRDEVLARLEKMLDYAVNHNVILLHENEKDIYGDVASRCADILNHFRSPAFRAVFDFANFVQCGQDTLEAYDLLRDHVTYIHIKDARRESGRVTPAGMGDGNVRELLSRFKDSGYQGFLSLEPHLQSFVGYSALEGGASMGAEKKSAAPADGAITFAIAANALKAILWDLDWR